MQQVALPNNCRPHQQKHPARPPSVSRCRPLDFSPDVRCKSRFVRAAVVMLPEPQRVSPFCLVLYMWGGAVSAPPSPTYITKGGVSIKRLNHIDRYPGVPSQPLLGGKQSGLSPDVPNRNPTPYVNMCSYHIERWESQLLTFYAGSLLHPSLEGTSAAFTSWYRSIGCMVFHLCH